jgi:hypothetical protein
MSLVQDGRADNTPCAAHHKDVEPPLETHEELDFHAEAAPVRRRDADEAEQCDL